MHKAVNEILAGLETIARHVNAAVFSTFPAADALTIWTEGGEWPAYSKSYAEFKLPAKVRDVGEVTYYKTEHIDAAVSVLDKALSTDNLCGISMSCGQGKSTKLVQKLHNRKIGMQTLVVEPSAIVAQSLVKYLAKPHVYFARSAAEVRGGREICYLSAGAMLDYIMSSKLSLDDVIVIDEAHSASLVHDVLERILGCYNNPVLMLTASTSAHVRARTGVKISTVQPDSPKLSDHLAREPAHVTVGVQENMAYAVPATPLIGITLQDLKLVYDTGLRPEPRVDSGTLIIGERKAIIGEIVQMAGRLGRCTVSGAFYYNPDAIPMKVKRGIPLYDVLNRAISVVAGLSDGDVGKMATVWERNGLLNFAAASGDSVVAPPKYSTEPPSVGGDAVMDTVLSGSDEDVGSSSEIEKKRGKRLVRQRRSLHVRSSSGSSASSDSSAEEQLNRTIVKQLKRGDRGISASLVVSRDKVGSFFNKRGRVSLAASVVDLDGGGVPVEFDKHRPFRRVQRDGSENTSLVGVVFLDKFWSAIAQAITAGDAVFPCKLPVEDGRQVNTTTQAEARLVLSRRALPTFAEGEVLSIISLWNRYVLSLGGRCACLRDIEGFIEYFKRYVEFVRTFKSQ